MVSVPIDNWWWAVALPPLLSSQHAGLLFFSFLLAFLLSAFLAWSYRGGPAWGKYWMGRPNRNGIPGPRGLPVLGSIGLMRGLAHRKLAAAAELGATRLMAFSMGSTRAIVTCHADVAKEILQGSAFADRPVKESAHGLMFDRAIGFAPYGAYWRGLRRIAAGHLFCPRQIDASESVRLEIAGRMCGRIADRSGTRFFVRDILRRASLDNVMACVFGRDYKLDELDSEATELREMVQEGYDILGKLDLADHLPFLAFFDFQNIRQRCSRLAPKVHRLVGKIIEEHRSVAGAKRRTDFVDVLLSLTGKDKLSDSDMVAVLWEMIFRGTDTVAVLIEWILARLVMHGEVQAKVQEELDRVVGGRERPVREADVAGLRYLPAVVKEVLRLHPPGPLLSWARLATEDAVVDGWHVPAGTTAMVNMWAIARDPDVWPDPLRFSPERFLASGAQPEFSVLGSDLRLAPFGSGRRSCPGKALGLATVQVWLAALLHEFTWLPAGSSPVDLSEVLRLSCEMASPLAVKVVPRRK
ncbi:cytochrome P450 78A3-like [Nymphaea colorata]|nr:cytochrome P450 78A3-like [Nymphaea colorata]